MIRKLHQKARQSASSAKTITTKARAKTRSSIQKGKNLTLIVTDKKKRQEYIQNRKISNYESGKNWQAVIAVCEKHISDSDGVVPDIYVRLSRAYLQLGDASKAEDVLLTAAKRYPEEASHGATDNDLRAWLVLSRERAKQKLDTMSKNPQEYKARISRYKKEQSKKSSELKIAVISAISGGYDTVKPPINPDPRFDYIVYTDRPVKAPDIYKIRTLPYVDSDNTRSARFVKTNPHVLLGGEYDVVVWVDANLLITGDIYPIVKDVLDSGKPFGAMRHAVRNSPYDEMEACIKQRRDDPEIIKQQLDYYKKQKYDTNEMIESNVLVYDLRNGRLDTFLNDWWGQIDRFSRRDQFSINYCLDKNNIDWHKFTKYPDTARNHPALALTDHVPDGSDESTLYKFLEAINAKELKPVTGVTYKEVKPQRLKKLDKTITGVVCVHNAYEDVKKFLDSIKKNKSTKFNLIIMDDGSEKQTVDYLKDFTNKNSSWTKLVRHQKAHGYTRTASEGLQKSKADLTILLNSDTIVTKDWDRKMADVAYSLKYIGIVGPLSSAASHQSVPDIQGSKDQTAINDIPDGVTIDDMNEYAEQWSREGEFPLVPLVHGFCFGVTREVIDAIGYLDEKSFPRGYGEENDYCFRASNAGFKLAIATNTYVYHAKSKSFVGAERKKLMDAGMQAFVQKHGQTRINRAVATMKENPMLIEIRNNFAKLYK